MGDGGGGGRLGFGSCGPGNGRKRALLLPHASGVTTYAGQDEDEKNTCDMFVKSMDEIAFMAVPSRKAKGKHCTYYIATLADSLP